MRTFKPRFARILLVSSTDMAISPPSFDTFGFSAGGGGGTLSAGGGGGGGGGCFSSRSRSLRLQRRAEKSHRVRDRRSKTPRDGSARAGPIDRDGTADGTPALVATLLILFLVSFAVSILLLLLLLLLVFATPAAKAAGSRSDDGTNPDVRHFARNIA